MKASINSLLLLFFFVGIAAVSSQTNKFNQLAEQSQEDRFGVTYMDNVSLGLTDRESKMIGEVFGSKSKKLLLDNPSYLKDIKHLLRNRIEIFKIEDLSKQKKTKMLSEIPLNKTYNQSLTRDSQFDKATFNPLKYQLDFFARGTYLYQVDGTDFFIQVTSQYRK